MASSLENIPLYPAMPASLTFVNLSTVSSLSYHLLRLALLGIATFIVYMTYLYLRLSNMKKVKPFKEIPTVPQVNWLLGVFPYFYTLDPSSHHSIFSTHSSPSGITGIWGDFDRRAFTVLRADHARAVLRKNSSRDPMKLITRHGAKTLGEDSLILIPGGNRWRKQRSVVAKMFTVDVMREGKKAVADCSRVLVRWLIQACSPSGEGSKSCPGHDEKGVAIEAEHLFKLYSLEVFGKVSMGYDFKCFHNDTLEEDHSCEGGKYCHCLKMSSMANSFAFLQDDVDRRARPQNIFNPLAQSYSLPTRYNREYKYHCKVVRGVVGTIIEEELDKILSVKNAQLDSEGGKRKEQGEAVNNLVTHLLRSTLEDQFNPSTGNASKSSLSSSGCPFSGSAKASSKSGCPFSTSFTALPHSLTPAQKQESVDKVMGILRTLLMAGYETTAVSLSYVMYYLSLSPRCQELCAVEAERVLGPRGNDAAYNGDFDPDDLVYCKAVFTEAIRLHLPIVFTTRVLEKDMSLDTGNGDERVTLPKGTKALISPAAIHRDERNFERATEFIPERWVRFDGDKWVDRNYEKESKNSTSSTLDADTASNKCANPTPESVSAANPQNFFAFSDGARNCVGKRLAVLESSVMIAMLFRDMKVDLAEEGFELATKRKFATAGPATLPVVFQRR